MVAHSFDIHFAYADTKSAVRALFLIQLNPQKRNAAEEAVQRAERAKETAEHTVDKYARYDNDDEKGKLPRKEGSQNPQHFHVFGICKQAHAPFQSPCGTDKLTKARYGKHNRQYHDEGKQHDVFKIGKYSRYLALSKLRGFDFIQQLLYQPDGTQKAANRSSQQQPKKNNRTEYVGEGVRFRLDERVLQGAERTSADCSGAGIAIQAGHANIFRGALINTPVEEALYIRVE